MKFSKLKFLCDENIDPLVIQFMKEHGLDAKGVKELKLKGKTDEQILKRSVKQQRVVLTHDSDFGKIVYSRKVTFVGIIFLRPGHFDAGFTIKTIQSLAKSNLSFEAPFIMVAEQKAESIKIRLRNNL